MVKLLLLNFSDSMSLCFGWLCIFLNDQTFALICSFVVTLPAFCLCSLTFCLLFWHKPPMCFSAVCPHWQMVVYSDSSLPGTSHGWSRPQISFCWSTGLARVLVFTTRKLNVPYWFIKCKHWSFMLSVLC